MGVSDNILAEYYLSLRHLFRLNQIATNVEARYPECSTRDFRVLQKYQIHSSGRFLLSLAAGLTVFKLRQYPNIKLLRVISPDSAALTAAALVYMVSAARILRNKIGDFMFPPEFMEVSPVCQDARNFYRYHCSSDYERLRRKYPAATKEPFLPKDDGYFFLARRFNYL